MCVWGVEEFQEDSPGLRIGSAFSDAPLRERHAIRCRPELGFRKKKRPARPCWGGAELRY